MSSDIIPLMRPDIGPAELEAVTRVLQSGWLVQGKEVERKARAVTIFRLQLLELEGNILSIAVDCSKGTYIRTLAEDIGEYLGCGAHILELHRSRVEGFDESDSLSMEKLESLQQQGMDILDSHLLPVDAALAQFPELRLSDADSLNICHGQRLHADPAYAAGLYRLRAADGRFLGLGEVFESAELKAKRLMNTAS